MNEMQKLQKQWENAASVKDTLTMRRVQQEMNKLLLKDQSEAKGA